MLEIRDLYTTVDGNEILKGITLTINKGEVHAIMGPNGSGKSTLAKVIAGHPSYIVTSGEVLYEGKNLLDLSPDDCIPALLMWTFFLQQLSVTLVSCCGAHDPAEADPDSLGPHPGGGPLRSPLYPPQGREACANRSPAWNSFLRTPIPRARCSGGDSGTAVTT